jgi:hypothetical protein
MNRISRVSSMDRSSGDGGLKLASKHRMACSSRLQGVTSGGTPFRMDCSFSLILLALLIVYD